MSRPIPDRARDLAASLERLFAQDAKLANDHVDNQTVLEERRLIAATVGELVQQFTAVLMAGWVDRARGARCQRSRPGPRRR